VIGKRKSGILKIGKSRPVSYIRESPSGSSVLCADSSDGLNNPFITYKSIYQKFRFAKATCLRVLHERRSFRRCYFRWAPHSMTQNEAQCRIAFSEEPLRVVQDARETSFNDSLLVTSYHFILTMHTIRPRPLRDPLVRLER
jgi:hypothetical protein